MESRDGGVFCPSCLMRQGFGTETGFGGEEKDVSKNTRLLPNFEEVVRFFPQFEILECLGRGGMGVVYKAWQKPLERLVALKILAPEREKDPEFAERFATEARTLAQLNHPNIVTVYEFGESHGVYFFAMEFVDGVNLRHLIAERSLSSDEALAIVPAICDALQYAHDRGVVHRDIKPENLLLDKSGRIKIADFGIAKLMERDGGAVHPDGEEKQVVAGTPRYMAPEQKEAGTSVDNRADIYSLGVVFYELLTGEVPKDDFQPPSSRPGQRIDVRLDEVVMKALEKAPGRRYQQASEIGTQVQTIVTSRGPAKGEKPEKSARSVFPAPWKAAVAVVMVAAGAFALAVFLPRQDEATDPPEDPAIAAAPETPEREETSRTEETPEVRFIRIPGGSFTMGSPSNEPGRVSSEGPQHTVTITRDFHIAATPVTWAQWIDVREWAAANGYTDLPVAQKGSHGDERNSDDDPVTMVSWWDAIQWLNAQSEKNGRTPVYYSSSDFGEENVIKTGNPVTYADWSADGYRLPTEAEWEYAVRAGTTTAFFTGGITHTGSEQLDPNLDRAGWYAGNSEGRTHPVAQKEPNPWGLYDVHGGVWEWCWNYEGTYNSNPQTDPRGPTRRTNRLRRGGSWSHDAYQARSAFRVYSGPFNRFAYVGLRPARNAEPAADTAEEEPLPEDAEPEAVEPADRYSETLPAVDRISAMSITAPGDLESVTRVRIAVTGRIEGTATMAGERIEGEVDLAFSGEIEPDASLDFEYIPINVTGGELTIEYWFEK